MGKDETMRARDKLMLQRAVQRGVEYLDANPDKEEAFQGWYRKITLNNLDLGNSRHCIIGQTLGDFGHLSQVDDFDQWTMEKLHHWAARHGFFVEDRQKKVRDLWNPRFFVHSTDHQWREDAYIYLTHLWSDAVLQRQMSESVVGSVGTTS
jgi:hypothetical protein